MTVMGKGAPLAALFALGGAVVCEAGCTGPATEFTQVVFRDAGASFSPFLPATPVQTVDDAGSPGAFEPDTPPTPSAGLDAGPDPSGSDQPGQDFAACSSAPIDSIDASGGVVFGAGPSPVTCAAQACPGFAGSGTEPPSFGNTVVASTPPSPVSGGTLIALRNGTVAVASDPDRDAVYVVDTALGAQSVRTIALQAGDEPGRLVEDGAGRVYVALRSGASLVTIDVDQAAILERRSVCPAPRGVAWDASTDLVWVACATGELVGLPAAGGPATITRVLERDLRDVLIRDGVLSVTKFRSAEVLRIAGDGTIARRDPMPAAPGFAPHVLWRAVEGPSQTMVAVHQEHSTESIPTRSGQVYGQAQGGVETQVTVLGDDGSVGATSLLTAAVLPVDVAVSPDGSYAVVVAAGDGLTPGLAEVLLVPLAGSLLPPSGGTGQGPTIVAEQAIAAVFDGKGHILVQTREPAALHIFAAPSPPLQSLTAMFNPLGGQTVPLSPVSRRDTGHDIFHAAAGAPIACASCHPEGGDDGHVWLFDGHPRRTPSLRGTIAGTAPYHWPGDEADLLVLTADVYTGRMGGTKLATDQMGALKAWIEGIPAPPAPSWVDGAAAARGKALFERADTQCSTCHAGAKLTNNLTMSVGTCGAFQVPPLLGVGWRTPLMHNGCASTLAERFTKCATPGHGVMTSLSASDVSDLVALLETL